MPGVGCKRKALEDGIAEREALREGLGMYQRELWRRIPIGEAPWLPLIGFHSPPAKIESAVYMHSHLGFSPMCSP